MNNRAFTIMELIAIVIILAVLASIATISVTKYREEVKQKELINLHSNIQAAYDKYRQDLILKGKAPLKTIDYSEITDDVFEYFSDLTYSGDKITRDGFRQTKFELRSKGDLLKSSKYQADDNRNHAKDSTCLVTSTIEQVTKNGEETKDIIKSCQTKDGKEVPSKEEILCIVLKRGNETLIDDYNKNLSKNELCTYFE